MAPVHKSSASAVQMLAKGTYATLGLDKNTFSGMVTEPIASEKPKGGLLKRLDKALRHIFSRKK